MTPHSSGSDSDTPERCRERRRRRIEKRRSKGPRTWRHSFPFPPTSPTKQEPYLPDDATASMLYPSHWHLHRPMPVAAEAGSSPEKALVDNPVPVYGAISIPGDLGRREDRISVKPDFCRVDFMDWQALHFFAVYDGHGGPHVSKLCRDMMYMLMEQELRRAMPRAENSGGGGGSTSGCLGLQDGQEVPVWAEEGWEEKMKIAVGRSFERMDQMALRTCGHGRAGYECSCEPMDLAFAGSTALVTVLTAGHLLVANCGDSRAVLCRAGKPVPLSIDHKPDRPDELARIHAAGGQLVYRDGSVRVCGILNMSRSLGDHFLKSIVTSEPEISITERYPEEDQCLILASDGLWDVVPEATVCELAITCLQDGSPATALRSSHESPSSSNSAPPEEEQPQVMFPSHSALASAILCRLAVARGSRDDVSVIVVDLKRHY